MPHPGGVALIVLLVTRVIGSHASPSTGQDRRCCVSGVRSKKCTILSVKRSTPGPSYKWQGGSVRGVHVDKDLWRVLGRSWPGDAFEVQLAELVSILRARLAVHG